MAQQAAAVLADELVLQVRFISSCAQSPPPLPFFVSDP